MPPGASPLTSEPLATLAHEAVELVDAGAGVLAGTGGAVVTVLVAVLAHPAGLAVAAVAAGQTHHQQGSRVVRPVTLEWPEGLTR